MGEFRTMRLLQIGVTIVSILYLGAAIGMAGASPAHDEGRRIAENGTAAGVPACTSCHGPDLQGGTAIGAPAIAGKPSEFILARLAHYASPAGHNPMMKQVATSLTAEESVAVANYASSIRSKPANP